MKPTLSFFILTLGCVNDPKSNDSDTSDTLDSNLDTDTSQGAPEEIPCDETTTTISINDITDLGFSGQDIIDIINTPTSILANWVDDPNAFTMFTIEVTGAGDPIFHDLEVSGDTGNSNGACTDYLEVPVILNFSTDDGAFDESPATTILVSDITLLSIGADLDPFNLNGSFVLTDIDPDEWDVITMDINNTWSGGGIQGQVNMSASRELSGDSGTLSGIGLVGPVLRWP